MKVALTRPVTFPRAGGVARCNDNGLGYLASACKAAGADVRINSWNEPLALEAFREQLRSFQPDVVGVKVFTPWFRQARATLSAVREESPSTWTIIGGPHPSTSRPDDLFDEFNGLIDFAVAGDGENAMKVLLPTLMQGERGEHMAEFEKVPGLIYAKSGHIISNSSDTSLSLHELDEQDWQLQKPEWFETKLVAGQSGNAALVSDSRGCPARCGHCMAWRINGNRIRKLQIEDLKELLGELLYEHRVRVVDFTGNCFLSDKDYVLDICDWFNSQNLKVTWACTGAEFVDTLRDRNFIESIAQAGCSAIHFGVESGNASVVRALKKPFTLPQISEAVLACSEARIRPLGYFMFGFPEETIKQMHDTISYSFSLPFESCSFCVCLPLPGTSSYEALLCQRGLDKLDWAEFDFERPDPLPCAASPKAVHALVLKARKLHMSEQERWKYRGRLVRHALGRMRNIVLR